MHPGSADMMMRTGHRRALTFVELVLPNERAQALLFELLFQNILRATNAAKVHLAPLPIQLRFALPKPIECISQLYSVFRIRRLFSQTTQFESAESAFWVWQPGPSAFIFKVNKLRLGQFVVKPGQ